VAFEGKNTENSGKVEPFDGKPQDTPPTEVALEKVSVAEMPTESETFSFELNELRQENLALNYEIKQLKERNDELEFIFSSDKKLAAALEESKTWQGKFKNQMLILNNFQTELNEHKKAHAYWKKQAGKLKFELDALKRTML
jgi:hypothetical protein